MDTAPRTHARRDRLIRLAALVLLSGAAAVVFGRTFVGLLPTVQLVGVATSTVVLAVAMERRGLLLALVASLAWLAVLVVVVVFPSTTWFGLPTAATVRALVSALGRFGVEAQRTAPTVVSPALMLAAVGAVWAVSTASHALLVRAHSAVLAILPAVTLFVFTEVILAEAEGRTPAIWMMLAILAVLFAGALTRVDLTARGARLEPPPRRSMAQLTAVPGARTLGVVSIVGALALASLVPEGSGIALPRKAGGEIEPFVAVAAQLRERDPIDLFRVRADAPSYWRMVTLDRFDGDTWTKRQPEAVDANALARVYAPSQQAGGTQGRIDLSQEIVIDELSSPWLPAAAEATSYASSEIAIAPDLEELRTSAPPEEGSSYRVTSAVITPSAAQLERVGDVRSDPVLIPPEIELEGMILPSDFPLEVRTLARRLTADETSEYRKMLAIQDYLRTFDYDPTAQAPPGVDPLSHFLFVAKSGFCQQFSGSMAAMARSLGYPARVAVGFTSGVRAESGEWVVTTAEAHAWPEVWFPDVGWVAFEPTPSRPGPLGSAYLAPAGPGRPNGSGPGQNQGGVPRQDELPAGRPQAEDTRGGGSPTDDGTRDGPAGGFWLLMLGLVLLVAIPTVRRFLRARRLQRARTDRSRVLVRFDLFEDRASSLGFARRRDETVGEYGDRLSELTSNPSAVRLTAAVQEAAYASAPAIDPLSIDAEAAEVLAALRDRAGRRTRALAAYR